MSFVNVCPEVLLFELVFVCSWMRGRIKSFPAFKNLNQICKVINIRENMFDGKSLSMTFSPSRTELCQRAVAGENLKKV